MLVQPEMERGRRLSLSMVASPQSPLLFRLTRSFVAAMPIRLNFRLARHAFPNLPCAKTSEVQFDFAPQKSGHEGAFSNAVTTA